MAQGRRNTKCFITHMSKVGITKPIKDRQYTRAMATYPFHKNSFLKILYMKLKNFTGYKL